MLAVVEVLEKAKGLIAEPEHWTRGAEARNSEGESVSADSPEACAWCLDSALYRAAGTSNHTYYYHAESALSALINHRAWRWNDSHTHAQVIALLDKAIAIEREKLT